MHTISLSKASTASDGAAARRPGPFNLKVADPSRLMYPADGRRYQCAWIEHGLSIHSDGNVTCGLDDPHGQRSFGNIHTQSVAEIWANPEYERMQRNLWEGQRCNSCNMSYPVEVASTDVMPARSPRPSTLVVEATIKCNLRCPQPACIPNNEADAQTRDAAFLDLDAFGRVADELAGAIHHVYFYNYGDAFVHVGAEDMLARLRQTSPNARIITSTNGAPLAKMSRARKLVASEGLDHIVFTIGGVRQESYSRYHVGGRVDLALQGMFNVMQARRELGLSRPVVHWRYLMFHWNDGDAEIEAAARLVEEHGIDEFSLYLTHVPAGSRSFRFGPGSPNFAMFREHIENSLGYTLDLPVPDQDGFYPLEETSMGPARWTSWQARRRLPVEGGRVNLVVSTFRPERDGVSDHVFIVTPWRTVKVPLQPGAWRTVEISVPDAESHETVEVELVTFDHWFPAEELGSNDLRCLGVVVREDKPGADPGPAWSGFSPIDADEAARLAGFKYAAPRPLVDW